MLSKKELTAIKKALPEKGLTKVAEKSGHSYANVQRVLCDPKRYKKDIIDAALAVIEEKRIEVDQLKLKIKQIIR